MKVLIKVAVPVSTHQWLRRLSYSTHYDLISVKVTSCAQQRYKTANYIWLGDEDIEEKTVHDVAINYIMKFEAKVFHWIFWVYNYYCCGNLHSNFANSVAMFGICDQASERDQLQVDTKYTISQIINILCSVYNIYFL